MAHNFCPKFYNCFIGREDKYEKKLLMTKIMTLKKYYFKPRMQPMNQMRKC